MHTVVIPANAYKVPCPNCGQVLLNLQPLGVRRQVGCKCGARVVVERRAAADRRSMRRSDRRKTSHGG